MKNSLMLYLNKRMSQNDPKYQKSKAHPGPVICISREVGCGGVKFARLLAAEFEKLSVCTKWKVISKEILTESARELDMDRDKLRQIMKEGERGVFDEILAAFSDKRFKSDRKISKTLADLIRSFAIDGHCIIVGRAGHIFARDIEKSLLVRLTASKEWRIKQIMEKNNLNLREAIEFIDKTEKERQNFRRYFSQATSAEDEFDLTINISRISIPDAIDLIRFAAQNKGLLETHKSKVEVF
jgi:cytidylate kinase